MSRYNITGPTRPPPEQLKPRSSKPAANALGRLDYDTDRYRRPGRRRSASRGQPNNASSTPDVGISSGQAHNYRLRPGRPLHAAIDRSSRLQRHRPQEHRNHRQRCTDAELKCGSKHSRPVPSSTASSLTSSSPAAPALSGSGPVRHHHLRRHGRDEPRASVWPPSWSSATHRHPLRRRRQGIAIQPAHWTIPVEAGPTC
jgi:hypothetical protein